MSRGVPFGTTAEQAHERGFSGAAPSERGRSWGVGGEELDASLEEPVHRPLQLGGVPFAVAHEQGEPHALAEEAAERVLPPPIGGDEVRGGGDRGRPVLPKLCPRVTFPGLSSARRTALTLNGRRVLGPIVAGSRPDRVLGSGFESRWGRSW